MSLYAVSISECRKNYSKVKIISILNKQNLVLNLFEFDIVWTGILGKDSIKK